MSDDKLQFQLALIDKMSGPARGAAQSMNQLHAILMQFNQTNIQFNQYISNSSSGLAGWTTAMGSAMYMAEKLKDTVIGVASAVANLTANFVSSVIEQAKFHARSMTTLNALFHDEPGRARREFNAAIRLGQILPGTTRDAAEQRIGLASQGFMEGPRLDRAFALQQDLSALSLDADNAGLQGRVTEILGRIQSDQYLSGEVLRQFRHLHTAVGQAQLFEEIAKGRNLHGSQKSVNDQIEGLIRDKQIGADEAIQAMERAVTRRTGTALGGFAHEQGTGLLGQLSNFEETPQRVLQQWFARQESTVSSGGMSAFMTFLTKFNNFFQAGSASGERFMAMLDRLINGVFKALFGNDPTKILNDILTSLEQWTPEIIKIVGLFPKFVQSVIQLLPQLDRMFNALERMGPLLTFLLQEFTAFVTSLGDMAQSPVFNLITGLVDGMDDMQPEVSKASERLANTVQDSFEKKMEIHSPSRVMMRMGGHIGEGLALGMEAKHPRVGQAMDGFGQATKSISDFSGGGAGSGGAWGNNHASLTVNFNIPDTASSAQEIADAARPMLETAIAELVERVAISAGVG